MLPVTVFIVRTTWRDETSMSDCVISGEMTRFWGIELSERERLVNRGAPFGVEPDCPQIEVRRRSP